MTDSVPVWNLPRVPKPPPPPANKCPVPPSPPRRPRASSHSPTSVRSLFVQKDTERSRPLNSRARSLSSGAKCVGFSRGVDVQPLDGTPLVKQDMKPEGEITPASVLASQQLQKEVKLGQESAQHILDDTCLVQQSFNRKGS